MSAPPRTSDGCPPIGREGEAARLAHIIDDAAAGAKRAALLLGVPGIGKTTLLRWGVERARRRDLVSVHVRVPMAAGLPPRFPLGEVLDGLLRAHRARGVEPPERLRRVVDTLTGASSVGEYAVDLPQVADALEDAGRLGALAVFVDDYDWAPPEGTAPLVAALRVVETPLCFVATARLRGLGDEPPSPLPEPTADLWVEHLEVRGLDPAAVAALAAVLLEGAVLPSLAEALYARTLGNPLFIVETLAEWRKLGALTRTGGFWGVDEEAASREIRSLREMIAARLARLPEEALEAARALAVVARETEFEELAGIVGAERPALVEALCTLTAEGFVSSDATPGPRYRLAHPLYESTLAAEMGDTTRALLHGRVLAELRRRAAAGDPVSAAELAHHAVRALERPADLRAILAAAAAEAEGAGSFEEAATW
jgi:predicted ATPase